MDNTSSEEVHLSESNPTPQDSEKDGKKAKWLCLCPACIVHHTILVGLLGSVICLHLIRPTGYYPKLVCTYCTVVYYIKYIFHGIEAFIILSDLDGFEYSLFESMYALFWPIFYFLIGFYSAFVHGSVLGV
ncbi:hypothetical protein DFJ63DRAFT_314984 [Scheffersomyces coipomensis]|uniref:uncharacterized protein n=1 Tax=Scheffersomyces coipomensis TaxID=1788519 RepID=UPI00315C6B9F